MKLNIRKKKINPLFLLKTGIGSALAILLAEMAGLLFSPSAGIITLLTIQNTKKETIFIALRRILAFLLAVISAYVVFSSFGYTSIAFGCFVILFVALCYIGNLKDGISMNAVLTTHFLIEKRMDKFLIINEVALLLIGMSIGIGLNLLMPRNLKKIRREQKNFELKVKELLSALAIELQQKEACLIQKHKEVDKQQIRRMDERSENWTLFTLERRKEQSVNSANQSSNQFHMEAKNDLPGMFLTLESQLTYLITKAYENADNTLLSDTRYLISYFEMRKLQLGVLRNIKVNIDRIPVLLKQTIPVSEFISHISNSFHERNNAIGLMKELEELKEYFRKEVLPVTREEFEYRAILYQILMELEYFLELKRDFVRELEEKEMITYWDEKS
ncbi:MAG: putative rane protein [Herbinix sp.]|jgi:uncharacterized membrane protein YgaE (UPF0421/DUF939 family)|nr:putative rane protein [Herbinix sp.]